MFQFEGFSLMLLNLLKIPPGSSVRRASGGAGDTDEALIQNNEIIQTILDITKDDVCIGNSPLYFKCDDSTPEPIRETIESILAEFNSIVKWAAVDLLATGFSAYRAEAIEGEYLLFPVIEPLTFYLDYRKRVIVYDEEENQIVDDILLFINYDKSTLEEIEDNKIEHLKYKINPSPVQLKNIGSIAGNLNLTERSIVRYRHKLSRIIRFATVDVGLSQGDRQQEVIDTISNALNADSESMGNMHGSVGFDDAIPIIPVRKNIGKPDVTEHVSSADITNLADLDHQLNKLFLVTRFPKSYADFSQPLGDTAVSLIRSDVRYNKLITKVRTLIEDTINAYLGDSNNLSKWKVTFHLSEIPTPEDEDVIAALESYSDFLDNVYEMIFKETATEGMAKIGLLEDLLGGSTNLPSINKFLTDLRTVAETKIEKENKESSDLDEGDDFDMGGFGGSSGSPSIRRAPSGPSFGDLGDEEGEDFDIPGQDDAGFEISSEEIPSDIE